jgi:RNA recognition motif-containing protein
MPADIRSRLNRQAISPTNRSSPGRVGFQPQQSVLRKVTEDCTIFVGSLPPAVTQEQLIRLFGGFGHIKSVEIVAKPSVNSMSLLR